MRICLVSSSFYPAILYGGPIFSTWDISNELAEQIIMDKQLALKSSKMLRDLRNEATIEYK